jgi:hypothetical protein
MSTKTNKETAGRRNAPLDWLSQIPVEVSEHYLRLARIDQNDDFPTPEEVYNAMMGDRVLRQIAHYYLELGRYRAGRFPIRDCPLDWHILELAQQEPWHRPQPTIDAAILESKARNENPKAFEEPKSYSGRRVIREAKQARKAWQASLQQPAQAEQQAKKAA